MPRALHLGPVLNGYDNALDVILDGGYIRIVQDCARQARFRGGLHRHSPPAWPAEQTPVDHATDTYDTIDWLVKNVPEEQRQGRHPGDLPTTASFP